VLPSRIVVFDSHRTVGAALAAALSAEPDMTVVDVAGDSRAARAALAAHDVDVLVLDPQTSDEDGIEFLRRLRDLGKRLRIVVVTETEDSLLAAEAIRAGACAWVPKRLGMVHLVRVVRGARVGEGWLSPRMLGQVLDHFADPRPIPVDPRLASLTTREREVLLCMVNGLDRQAIAERLFLSTNTVRTHIQHVLGKLGVHSAPEAVVAAVRAGLSSVNPESRPPIRWRHPSTDVEISY
jgi:DNA-binding NarL/FixJ family response regulator